MKKIEKILQRRTVNNGEQTEYLIKYIGIDEPKWENEGIYF
jgi:hypothetical protein